MSMKVLIADPDWRFTGQATAYLESHAHLVVTESRPKEIRTHVEHWQPDLVVLAAELADKGAIDWLNTLGNRPAVLLTGRMDRYSIAWKAWQKGGDELLMKPVFKSEEIHDAIVTAMENRVSGARVRPMVATA